MIRATPVILRRTAEVADGLKKAGIMFVTVPVRSLAEYEAMTLDVIVRVEEGFTEGGD